MHERVRIPRTFEFAIFIVIKLSAFFMDWHPQRKKTEYCIKGGPFKSYTYSSSVLICLFEIITSSNSIILRFARRWICITKFLFKTFSFNFLYRWFLGRIRFIIKLQKIVYMNEFSMRPKCCGIIQSQHVTYTETDLFKCIFLVFLLCFLSHFCYYFYFIHL